MLKIIQSIIFYRKYFFLKHKIKEFDLYFKVIKNSTDQKEGLFMEIGVKI